MKNNIILVNVDKSCAVNVDCTLERGKRAILEWFEKSNLDPKITVYIYENKEKLREGIKRLFRKNITSNNISYTIKEDINKNIHRSINIVSLTKKITTKEYNNIIYKELSLYLIDYLYPNLPEWLITSLINHLNNTHKYLNIDYLNLRMKSSLIPKIDELSSHPMYDEYSYIIVKYIIEKYGKSYLLEKLEEKDHFYSFGEKYLTDAILFYNK